MNCHTREYADVRSYRFGQSFTVSCATSSPFASDHVPKGLDYDLSVHLYWRIAIREGIRLIRRVVGVEHDVERLGGADRLVQGDHDVGVLALAEGGLADGLGNLRIAVPVVSVDGYPTVDPGDGRVAGGKRRPVAALVFETGDLPRRGLRSLAPAGSSFARGVLRACRLLCALLRASFLGGLLGIGPPQGLTGRSEEHTSE